MKANHGSHVQLKVKHEHQPYAKGGNTKEKRSLTTSKKSSNTRADLQKYTIPFDGTATDPWTRPWNPPSAYPTNSGRHTGKEYEKLNRILYLQGEKVY